MISAVSEGVSLGSLDDSGQACWGDQPAVDASLVAHGGASQLRLSWKADGKVAFQSQLSVSSVMRASPCMFVIQSSAGRQGPSQPMLIHCTNVQVGDQLQSLIDSATATTKHDGHISGSGSSGARNVFDIKTDKSSSDLYFSYYGMLMHQQNMLQDFTRTGTYYVAIAENQPDFAGKAVMDVGAGTGILSLFAAQAGARKVYAVEASAMANYTQQLANGNPSLGSRLQVINSKVEEAHGKIQEKVDVLISEPMGTLLVNERMLETYLYARDHFLAPGGKMFPQVGRIHVAAFSDHVLYNEVLAKSCFWMQPNFYGVDVSSLQPAAMESYFAQVVVDAFDPSVLASDCSTKVFDFLTMKEEELHDIRIPLTLTVRWQSMT